MNSYAVSCAPESAPKLADWIANRGGVAVWKSINLSNPGAEWMTPSLDAAGNRTPKPTWQAGNEPDRVVAHTDRVGVMTVAYYKRVRVALRLSGSGLSLKLTDHSQHTLDRVMAECREKHGSAFYERADEDGRPGMNIYYTTGEVSLTEWLTRQ